MYVKDDYTYNFARLPIVIPDINYAHKPKQSEILSAVIQEAFSACGIANDQKPLLYVTMLKDQMVELEGVSVCDKTDSLRALSPLDFVYFSHLHAGTNQGILKEDIDFDKILQDIFLDEKKITLVNYFENLLLYPQIQPSSDRDFYEEKAYLKQIAQRAFAQPRDDAFSYQKPLLFCTTRSVDTQESLCRFMLLGMNVILAEGLYAFSLDPQNFMGPYSVLTYFNSDISSRVELPDFTALGSLVNINDSVVCSFRIEGSEPQSVKVEKDQIFTYPLAATDSVDVTITSSKYPTIEKKLFGGTFGVVIDTRDKTKQLNMTPAKKQEQVQKWESTLLAGMKGL